MKMNNPVARTSKTQLCNRIQFMRNGSRKISQICCSTTPSRQPTAVTRRTQQAFQAQRTSAAPSDRYKSMRKHPELFDTEQGWRTDWFPDELIRFQNSIGSGIESAVEQLVKEESSGIYSFPLFRVEFCNMLMEEMENYCDSGLPIRRPNSMNNYGLVLNEIGMRDMITQLQQQYLLPIAKTLFPVEGSQFDFHHSFIVKYKQGEDLGLDMHTDDSDVTFNVCLGREFTGAGLTFCGRSRTAAHRKFQFKYPHVVGRCVVHLGSHRHGADDLATGERNNLIIWNHNKRYRATGAHIGRSYEKEDGPPDPECLSFTHDRDYGHFRSYPPGKEHFKSRGWCPPPQYCYDEMRP
mmetsp:Transcript_21650/g.51719  ORF Transcript_21650/g.51719 Transcript_21650/m.51719 type:complete len:351 (+) Transcript_21650:65-1117(+)